MIRYDAARIRKDNIITVVCLILIFFGYFFGGLECTGHSFAYVALSNPENCRIKQAHY